jgi:hypothetical protein
MRDEEDWPLLKERVSNVFVPPFSLPIRLEPCLLYYLKVRFLVARWHSAIIYYLSIRASLLPSIICNNT